MRSFRMWPRKPCKITDGSNPAIMATDAAQRRRELLQIPALLCDAVAIPINLLYRFDKYVAICLSMCHTEWCGEPAIFAYRRNNDHHRR